MKRLIHTCFILFKGKISSLFCFWPDGPHEHLLCTLSALLELQRLGGCVRLQMIWGERGRERGEKNPSVLNGFGASKLILVDPLHTEPPFQSSEPPRLLCSNEKEKEKGRLLQTEIKKKRGYEREKRGLEAFHIIWVFQVRYFWGGWMSEKPIGVFFVLKCAI